jgi:hypothetical protein
VRGLEIAAVGARLGAELTLPPLNPAGQLYRLLLDHGQPAPAGTYPSPEKARAAVTWLPAPLRDPVLSILVAGNRLAQEAVGREVLARTEVLSVTGSAFSAGPCPADPHT